MTTRRDESGFALLLVFVMAAAIAITLYIEVPRMAFESQRAREQMAIDRGLQYKRAIQLFYRKYQTSIRRPWTIWRPRVISASCATATWIR